jgi:hypothetical protein
MRNARKAMNYGLDLKLVEDRERKLETPRKEHDSQPGVGDGAQESRTSQG